MNIGIIPPVVIIGPVVGRIERTVETAIETIGPWVVEAVISVTVIERIIPERIIGIIRIAIPETH